MTYELVWKGSPKVIIFIISYIFVKHLLILAAALTGFNAYAHVETIPNVDFSASTAKSLKVTPPVSGQTSLGPGLLLGFGLLPNHQLSRNGTTSTPIRVQVMGTRLYKSFGLFAAIEFASADTPFRDASGTDDPSTWVNSYFRNMLGLNFFLEKFGAYAGMDLFSSNGFFSTAAGSGRKTVGVSYKAYKGLTLSLDFSASAGPGIGVNYLIPLNGLK